MVLTKKFSEFVNVTPATISDANEKLVGLESGANMQSTRFFTWTTAGRPPTPFNGLLGLNTTLQQYEYYDSVSATWVQLEDSGDIAELIARLAAHTVGDGASMIGLQDQANVTNKTVQDLANATILTLSSNGTLENGSVVLAGSGVTFTPGVGTLTISATGSGGTVTSLTQSTGISLTPNPITTTGSIALADVATLTGLVNLTGGAAPPIPHTLTEWLDAAIGSTRGDILYRNATVWTVLAPSTAGFALQTGGVGADPSWGNTFTNSTLVTPVSLGVQQQALNMNSHLINNVTDPVSAQDAATKNYVDQNALTGTSVYAATINTTMNATQAGAGVGATLTDASGTFAALSLDGVAIPLNSDVLVKNTGTGVTAANEGIYKLTTNGDGISIPWQLTRSVEYDTPEQINNTGLIIVQNGATLAGTAWYNTATIVTVDTTNFNYAQFGTGGTITSISAGNGIALNPDPIITTGSISASQPNLIIGGNFDTNPWQRGTSFTAPSSGTYTADRFILSISGTGVVDILKTADAPTVAEAGIFSSNCFHWDVTTADASIGATDVYNIRYIMEGYDWAQLAQREFTISFWVKATLTGIYSIAFRNSGTDRTYVSEYTINTTDTWEFKSITVSASPSSGTWNYTNGTGLAIFWTIAAGSDFQTSSLDTWNSDGLITFTNQVNGMNSTSNNFKLQLIKIEPGNVATPWQPRTEAEELSLCQRYYTKTFNADVAPAQATTSSAGALSYYAVLTGVNIATLMWMFPVKMRAAPSLTFYSTHAASSNWYNISDVGSSGTSGAGAIGQSSSLVINNQIATDAIGENILLHGTANAEL